MRRRNLQIACEKCAIDVSISSDAASIRKSTGKAIANHSAEGWPVVCCRKVSPPALVRKRRPAVLNRRIVFVVKARSHCKIGGQAHPIIHAGGTIDATTAAILYRIDTVSKVCFAEDT